MKTQLAVLALAAGISTATPNLPDDVLLVVWGTANPPHPNSSSVGMFSPEDGAYLGDLVAPDNGRMSFPNTIVVGPDRLLYISDSVNDSVFRYRLDGTFHDAFLRPSDGICNVRGLCFVGDELLVSNNPISLVGGALDYSETAILRFDLEGNELEPFIPAGQEISAWDIYPVGDLLLINDVHGVSTPTPLRAYDHDANVVLPGIIDESFPTQITESHIPGSFYQFAFSGRVKEFDLDGLIRSFTLPGLANMSQGLAALDNGNFLVSNFNAGVYRFTGAGAPMGPVREGFGIYTKITRVKFCDGDIWFDGVLNMDDVERFVETYLNQDPIADLAEPAGTWNVDDIDAFVSAFLGGCG